MWVSLAFGAARPWSWRFFSRCLQCLTTTSFWLLSSTFSTFYFFLLCFLFMLAKEPIRRGWRVWINVPWRGDMCLGCDAEILCLVKRSVLTLFPEESIEKCWKMLTTSPYGSPDGSPYSSKSPSVFVVFLPKKDLGNFVVSGKDQYLVQLPSLQLQSHSIPRSPDANSNRYYEW